MKKMLKTLVASVAVLALGVTTAFAAPSINVNGSAVGDVLVNGQKVEATVSFTNDFTNVESAVKELINEVNAGTNIAEVLADVTVEGAEGLTLKEYSLATTLQDLVAVDANGNALKNVTITWEVPNLVQNMGDVKVLHYSTERKVWEIINPNNVDFAAKTVTATFKDLSPVGVIYKNVASNGNGSTTVTPGTGNGSTNTLPETGSVVSTTQIALVALVAVVGGVVLTRRSAKKASN